MKHEGAATSFERLDRELLEIRKRISLSYLFSWNYGSKIEAARALTRSGHQASPPVDRITGWELGALFLTLCVLFCSCKEREKDSTPEISDPFRPPRPAHRILGAQDLQDGSFVIIIKGESL